MNNMKIFAKETIVSLYLYLFKLTLELNGHGASNKTKDWALVQTAALVINKGVQVRLSIVKQGEITWPNQTYPKISYPNLIQPILTYPKLS